MFVEQDRPGSHRDDPGEREALLLPSRQVRRGAVGRDVEADGGERRVHARPDVGARHAQVLAPEGDVVAHPREDRLTVGVLQHHARPAAHRCGERPVDEQLALVLALVRAAEDARDALQQRRLARARGAEQQHPLPRRDAERGIPHRPRLTRRIPPAPPARLDGGGGGHAGTGHTGSARIARAPGPLGLGGGHTRAVASRPDANLLSAPVEARAFMSSHPPRPAMTAPEIVVEVM